MVYIVLRIPKHLNPFSQIRIPEVGGVDISFFRDGVVKLPGRSRSSESDSENKGCGHGDQYQSYRQGKVGGQC